MMLEKQTQDAERLSAEEYAVVAKDLDTIFALLIDLVYKKTQSLNKVIKDYRKNNPQRLEQIIEFFENFVRDYKM